jgi:ABC-2 type transport system permease protein
MADLIFASIDRCWPRSEQLMPDWLQTITLVNPRRYIMVIVKGIFLKDMPAEVVFGNIRPMASIAVVTLLFATLFFRRRLA